MAAGPASQGMDLFKSLVYDPLLSKATDTIMAALGIAGWGLFSFLTAPLGFIIGKLVQAIGNVIYGLIKDYVNVELIILKNIDLHAKFVSAQLQLRAIALAKGIDSKEFNDARDKQANAFADFILNPIY